MEVRILNIPFFHRETKQKTNKTNPYSNRSWKIVALRWNLWLTILLGPHIFFAWSYFIGFHGEVALDGDCIFWTFYPQVMIAFMVSDAALELSMLALFALPLYVQLQANKALMMTGPTSQLSEVMIRNMKYSLFIVSVDIAALAIDAAFQVSASGAVVTGDPYAEALILGGNFLLVADKVTAVLVIHMMTTGWIPLALRQRFLTSKASTAAQNESPMNNHPLAVAPTDE